MEQHIHLVGLNFRTAGVDVREAFALADACLPSIMAAEVTDAAVGPLGGIDELLVLSTCNRVELLAVGDSDTPDCLLSLWANAKGRPLEDLLPYVYRLRGAEAVHHLFSVAASLDSMVLGEPQILGQLKDAYRKATQAKSTGIVLNRLLHKAFSVAKRVRTETAVAASAVSISYAAVELAKRIFGTMEHTSAMLIGAGEMAELAAMHLLQAGVSRLFVVNRTLERARELATQFRGEALPFEQLADRLPEVDIVISSTGASETLIRARQIREVLRRRKNRPMFFIDIAVPRDIDPDVNNLDNVYLYDIDDLKEVIEENLAHRRDEADKARLIVTDEVDAFTRWLESLALQPTIMELLDFFEAHGKDELSRTLRRLGAQGPVDAATREALEALVRGLTRKLAHAPLMFLKQAQREQDSGGPRLVRRLFNLDGQRPARCAFRNKE